VLIAGRERRFGEAHFSAASVLKLFGDLDVHLKWAGPKTATAK
jgi:hypothetical protein